jgi:hypothetical protein
MPIEEVIERGREAGIQLNPSDVHSTRYYMRQEALAQLSSRPASVPQLVPATPFVRATPDKGKDKDKDKVETKPTTNILGLRAASSGKGRPAVKETRRSPAPAASAASIAAAAVAEAKKPGKQSPPVQLRGSLEEQLRQIVMRIGTERARRIIEQIENLQV